MLLPYLFLPHNLQSLTQTKRFLSLAVQLYFLLRPAQAPRLNPVLSFSIASATLTHRIRRGLTLINVPIRYKMCIYLFLSVLLLLIKCLYPCLFSHQVFLLFFLTHILPSLPPSLPIANHPQKSITGRVRREGGREGGSTLQEMRASILGCCGGIPIEGKLTSVLLIPHHRGSEAQVAAHVGGHGAVPVERGKGGGRDGGREGEKDDY